MWRTKLFTVFLHLVEIKLDKKTCRCQKSIMYSIYSISSYWYVSFSLDVSEVPYPVCISNFTVEIDIGLPCWILYSVIILYFLLVP